MFHVKQIENLQTVVSRGTFFKKLMILSGHSADYILFGLDDSIINDTKKCLEQYGYNKFVNALDVIKDISSFINNL